MVQSTVSVKKRIKRMASLGAAMLWGMLAVCVLTACAGTFAGQPTVTADDLTQSSNIQDVLEQDAGNGKNYAYQWDAGDIEATMAQRYEQEQAYFAQMDERLEEIENMTPEELAEAGVASVEQAREQQEMIKAHQLEKLEARRESLKKEAALDPVISPQEAANRAGVIMEELYGVDLSQQVLELTCFGASDGVITFADGSGTQRPVWSVSLPAQEGEKAGNVMYITCGMDLMMDATTGEIVSVTYTPGAPEFEQRRALPKPDCYLQGSTDGNNIGVWDANDASFDLLVEAFTPRLQSLLSGSLLTGGAQVTQVRAEVQQTYEDQEWNELVLYAECNNGSRYRFRTQMPYNPFGGREADTRYLLRGFHVESDTYGS